MKSLSVATLACMLLPSLAFANGPRTPVEALFTARGIKIARGKLIVSPLLRKRYQTFDPRTLRLKGRTRPLEGHLEKLVSCEAQQPMPSHVAQEMHSTSTTKTKAPAQAHDATPTKSAAKDSRRNAYRGFFSRLLFDVFGI